MAHPKPQKPFTDAPALTAGSRPIEDISLFGTAGEAIEDDVPIGLPMPPVGARAPKRANGDMAIWRRPRSIQPALRTRLAGALFNVVAGCLGLRLRLVDHDRRGMAARFDGGHGEPWAVFGAAVG
jgi:hypothetical protein